MDLTTPPKYDIPVIKKDQPDDSYKFQLLPPPTGNYPYHMDLSEITEPDNAKMTFHMLGDTGNVAGNASQLKVISAMIDQCNDPADNPQFLYHLGDIVYNFGEAEYYAKQFFKPYAGYPRPIVAIAGNHDSDVNQFSSQPYNSLEPFMAVFCDTEPRTVSFSENAARKSITQPNVYWTLKAPLANIIGLHSNVTKFGVVTDEQKAWFIEEMIAAGKEQHEKALVLCLHHAPYSADMNHGSSLPMITLLNEAFETTGVRPHIVFSGHVHNYQRFSKKYADGKSIPFIVAGGGGYEQLHPVVSVGDEHYSIGNPLLNNVSLENYCDAHHGFLKIVVEKDSDGLILSGEYFMVIEDANLEPMVVDRFEVRVY